MYAIRSYYGHYVVAYCPGCQTSLSSAEVGYEGSYKEVEDPSFYFKFKVANSESEFFLVWTTMPFTIITDTMLAVQPKADRITSYNVCYTKLLRA